MHSRDGIKMKSFFIWTFSTCSSSNGKKLDFVTSERLRKWNYRTRLSCSVHVLKLAGSPSRWSRISTFNSNAIHRKGEQQKCKFHSLFVPQTFRHKKSLSIQWRFLSSPAQSALLVNWHNAAFNDFHPFLLRSTIASPLIFLSGMSGNVSKDKCRLGWRDWRASRGSIWN